MTDEEQLRFEAFYHEHVAAVFAFASGRSTPEIAKDAVEETFVIAWNRFEQLPDEPRAWLLGVTRRVLSHQWRGRDRRSALGLRIAAVRVTEFLGRDPADEVIGRDAVRGALDRLSTADRELLTLLAWGEVTAEDAAKVLRCSLAALRVRLHRARRRFEAALAEEDADTRADPRTSSRERTPDSLATRSFVPKEQPS